MTQADARRAPALGDANVYNMKARRSSRNPHAAETLNITPYKPGHI